MCLSAGGRGRGRGGQGVRHAALHFKLRVGSVQNNMKESIRGACERVAAAPGRLCVFPSDKTLRCVTADCAGTLF